jgi:hypothetical protein
MQVQSSPKTTLERYKSIIQSVGLVDFLNGVTDAIFELESDSDPTTKAQLEEIVGLLESATSIARDVNLD